MISSSQMESTLTNKLLNLIEIFRKIEVLKNIMYYSINNEFELIARHRASFTIIHFLSRFKEVATQQLIRIAFKQLYDNKDEINRGQFLLSFRPEVLENKQITKQHNVTHNHSKIMTLLVSTMCQKAIAKDDLSAFTRDNFDWFRQSLKVFTGRIQMRQFLRLFKQHKLTSFQMELFMNQFFKKQQTISINQFCGMKHSWNQTLSMDSKISLPMSTLSCDSLTLPTPYIYQCFLNYIMTGISFQSKIQIQTQMFNESYNQVTFKTKIIDLYRKGLMKTYPQSSINTFQKQSYLKYQNKKIDLDLKQFTFVVNELKLQNVNDKKIRIFFNKLQTDGLLSIDSFYDIMNNKRLCASIQQQIPNNNKSFEQLLLSQITLFSNLEQIKQTIWCSERIQLFELFKAIDVFQEGQLTIQAIQEFYLKNCLSKKSDQVIDTMVRIFGENKISLRDFILQFVVIS